MKEFIITQEQVQIIFNTIWEVIASCDILRSLKPLEKMDDVKKNKNDITV